MIYSSSSPPSAFSAIRAVDWNTPRACNVKQIYSNLEWLFQDLKIKVSKEKQYFGQEDDEQTGQYLHPLEVFLGIIVSIEVLVCLDPDKI